LWEAFGHAYEALGVEAATGGDEVFRVLVLARIIEPTGKLDSLCGSSRRPVSTGRCTRRSKRRLPAIAEEP
jgi:hypothetical protein